MKDGIQFSEVSEHVQAFDIGILGVAVSEEDTACIRVSSEGRILHLAMSMSDAASLQRLLAAMLNYRDQMRN